MLLDPRALAFTDLAQDFSASPQIRTLARRIAGIGTPVDATLPSDVARTNQCARLLTAVQRRVKYAPQNDVTDPITTWVAGAGDCKSSSTLLAALARSLGARVSFEMMGWVWGDPTHVCALLQPCGGMPFLYAETTLPAQLGEHPSHTLARTGGYPGRKDLAHGSR